MSENLLAINTCKYSAGKTLLEIITVCRMTVFCSDIMTKNTTAFIGLHTFKYQLYCASIIIYTHHGTFIYKVCTAITSQVHYALYQT